jgi:predicted aspartyl protease
VGEPYGQRIDTPGANSVLLGDREEVIMDPMGTFRVVVEIANPMSPNDRSAVGPALVDTGAELSWFPRDVLERLGIEPVKVWHFRQADGTVLERWTGGAWIHVAGTRTLDEVVFGEPGDLVLLGARSLEGLNLRVEPASKRLVDAGPAPAATAA